MPELPDIWAEMQCYPACLQGSAFPNAGPTLGPCLPANAAVALTRMLGSQAAFVAVSTYLHCVPEPADASAMALLATLRKRLSLARTSLAPDARNFQMLVNVMPCHAGSV